MTRDEVIYALERCTSSVPDACVDCPLWKENQSDYISCRTRLMREALALLKQDEKRGRWVDVTNGEVGMIQKEAIRIIENHIRIHSKQEPFRACHIQEALEIAVDALKAQEPVEPVVDIDTWKCGNCGRALERQELLGDNVLFHEQYNYCPGCGRAVKWE